MVKAQYSPQQLAERFIDQREIQNVMGKYALLTMICKQADLVDRFWSKQADQPTLAKNDGWYVGLDAIRGYYQAISDQIGEAAKLLKKVFPKQLGDKTDEEAFGAGEHFPRPLTTPIVEVAADGKTAKGLWQVMGANNAITPQRPAVHLGLGLYRRRLRTGGRRVENLAPAGIHRAVRPRGQQLGGQDGAARHAGVCLSG